MMTILLYGFLGKKFGKVHRYAVSTPAEAIAALSNTIPNFKKEVIDGGYYKVIRGGKEDAWGVNGENMFISGTKDTLRILPVVQGSGGGIGNIILGAILIYLAFWNPALLGTIGITGSGVTAVGMFGVSMLMGGISQVLFAPPEVNQSESNPAENKPSYSFNGPVNTVAQGGPIPICYGKVLAGSQVVSAGLSAEPLAI